MKWIVFVMQFICFQRDGDRDGDGDGEIEGGREQEIRACNKPKNRNDPLWSSQFTIILLRYAYISSLWLKMLSNISCRRHVDFESSRCILFIIIILSNFYLVIAINTYVCAYGWVYHCRRSNATELNQTKCV